MAVIQLAGVPAEVVGEPGPAGPVVVLLHGFNMRAADLAPFGAALRVPARFVFPEGLVDLDPLPGRAWWRRDLPAGAERLTQGKPRDLSATTPAGLYRARKRLAAVLREIQAVWRPRQLVLGGFSQGAMLACDTALHTKQRLAGLALLSGARLCAPVWRPLLPRLEATPVFKSHGRSDPELCFSAAESFHRDLVAAGADVSWIPFDGGHEISLVVLYHLRRFLMKCFNGQDARPPEAAMPVPRLADCRGAIGPDSR